MVQDSTLAVLRRYFYFTFLLNSIPLIYFTKDDTIDPSATQYVSVLIKESVSQITIYNDEFIEGLQ